MQTSSVVVSSVTTSAVGGFGCIEVDGDGTMMAGGLEDPDTSGAGSYRPTARSSPFVMRQRLATSASSGSHLLCYVPPLMTSCNDLGGFGPVATDLSTSCGLDTYPHVYELPRGAA